MKHITKRTRLIKRNKTKLSTEEGLTWNNLLFIEFMLAWPICYLVLLLSRSVKPVTVSWCSINPLGNGVNTPTTKMLFPIGRESTTWHTIPAADTHLPGDYFGGSAHRGRVVRASPCYKANLFKFEMAAWLRTTHQNWSQFKHELLTESQNLEGNIRQWTVFFISSLSRVPKLIFKTITSRKHC